MDKMINKAEAMAIFIDDNMKHNGYLVGGADYNAMGACTKSRPAIDYFLKAGFLKLVSEYNYQIAIEEHRHSKGGALYDKYMEQRSQKLNK